MPDIQIRVNMNRSGPIRNGQFQREIGQYCDDLQHTVALHGEDLIQQRLRQVLRNPTGYFQSRIAVERGRGGHVITDGGVIYGHWLEGTGSRNYPVTRFRGYSTFRRVKPLIDRDANRIGMELLARYQSRGLLR
ncbi:hypothetical protein YUYDRAFT_02082 [Streptomyces sp. ScaeMP-e48]|uniref:hypothetical protein n=1 Tax=Streptomyces sp. ScaeMP-e48 TaxID=1100823 RepID=UPI000823B319|nr:hypothetical protein [Streptomyces sp. ScaeMP-e48]SCK20095.1 hypothetical protein YUYDRAFT_02082 [Streptomyces sp. ScaeMP-e48]